MSTQAWNWTNGCLILAAIALVLLALAAPDFVKGWIDYRRATGHTPLSRSERARGGIR